MAIKISMLPYTFFIYSLSLLNKIPLPCCLPFSKIPQTNILFGHNKIYLFQIFSQIYINPNNRTHQPLKSTLSMHFTVYSLTYIFIIILKY